MPLFLSFLKRLGALNTSIIAVLLFIAVLLYLTTYSLAIDVLLFGLFALSYSILHGHMGQASFGHAMFFGLGGYFTGLLLYYFPLPLWLSWIYYFIGVAGATLVGFVIGMIVLQKRGVYFALTNFAFLNMFYFTMLQLKDITKGDDGIPNLPVLFDLAGMPFFHVCFVIVAASIFLMKRIFMDSSFGLVVHAVRETEERTEFAGYNTYWHMVKAYTLSSMFAGIAGGLYVMHLHHVGLTMLHMMITAEGIIVTVLGGVQVFIGPLAGAVIFYVLKDFVMTYTGHWMLVLGVLVMGLILFLKEGVLGRIKALIF